jgi:multiple sugar transport system substrate-binding protein
MPKKRTSRLKKSKQTPKIKSFSSVPLLPLICAGLLVVIVILFAGLMFMRKKPVTTSDQSINILWAQWTPADALQKLANEYTQETGVKVNIVQESWNTFQTRFFDEMTKKGQAYDMVVGDSQWLGQGATQGIYVELSDWIKEKNLAQSYTPAALSGYAEYPKGSQHYWAIPLEGDALGFAYRKDLFENPTEMANFKKRYGYSLDIPKTWKQFRDIAEFFYRPTQDMYGALLLKESKYDGVTMGVQSMIWSWGGDLGDPSTYRVKGIINSPASIEALKFYKEVNKFNNIAWKELYVSAVDSNQPLMDGKVAMGMGYFAIAPELLDPQKNPHAKDMGFFASPWGPQSQAASLGGQGLSIISYSKKKDLSLAFMEWISRDEIQRKWAVLGGLTTNKKVLASPEFLNLSPMNKAYVESTSIMKDFWSVPEYPQLLTISQKYFDKYLSSNDITAEQAMNSIANEWEQVFETAGYYKQ